MYAIALLLLVSAQVAQCSVFTYVLVNARNVLTNQSVETCANIQPRTWSSRSNRSEYTRLIYYNMTDRWSALDNFTIYVDNFTNDFVQGCQPVGTGMIRWLESMRERDPQPGNVLIGFNCLFASFYDPDVNGSLYPFPIFFMNSRGFSKIKSLFSNWRQASDVQLYFYFKEVPLFDCGILVILAIALFSVVAGGLWSGSVHNALRQHRFEEAKKRRLTGQTETEAEAEKDVEPETMSFSYSILLVFLVVTIAFLLLLYFFYEIFVWLILILYLFVSGNGVYACVSYILPKQARCEASFTLKPLLSCFSYLRRENYQFLKQPIRYSRVFLWLCCMMVSISWFVLRHWSFAFIFQDILSMTFVITSIRYLRLPSLKWLTLLLSCFLFYDIFMVFISPYVTGGCNIMLYVATGGVCDKERFGAPDNSRERLPISVMFPRVNDPYLHCYNLETDLTYPPIILGLGDILLPGILVGYAAAFDIAWNVSRNFYFFVAVISYTLALCVTFAASVLMNAAQPALLYIVPCMLIPIHFTALIRSQWKDMWNGNFGKDQYSEPEQSTVYDVSH